MNYILLYGWGDFRVREIESVVDDKIRKKFVKLNVKNRNVWLRVIMLKLNEKE